MLRKVHLNTQVKTRVVRNTCSPVYDETFTFYGISAEQLQSTTLHFAVSHPIIVA